jgi:TonB family protein
MANILLARQAARSRARIACAASVAFHALAFAVLLVLFPRSVSAPVEAAAVSVIIDAEAAMVGSIENRAQGNATSGDPSSPLAAATMQGKESSDSGPASSPDNQIGPPRPEASVGDRPQAVKGMEPSVQEPGAMSDTSEGRELPEDAAAAGPIANGDMVGATEPAAATMSGIAANESTFHGTAYGGGVIGGGASGLGSGASHGAGGTGRAGDGRSAFAAKVEAAIQARKTYPEIARRRGAEGVVKLKLRVSAAGLLLSAKVASSSGSAILDRAATELVSSAFPLENIAQRELEFVLAVKYSLED